MCLPSRLWYRLARADDDLKDRDERMRELEEQLARLQDDHSDLRQTYESLRAEQIAAESKLSIGVGGGVHSAHLQCLMFL